MKTEEDILQDLEPLETEEEIQEYLEQLWRDVRRDAHNVDRLRHHFNFDNMDLEEIREILDRGLDEVNHK